MSVDNAAGAATAAFATVASASAPVLKMPERELPKFAKAQAACARRWLRPGEISRPSPIERREAKCVLGLPSACWSVHNVRRNLLVDSDWFLSGLCSSTAFAPGTPDSGSVACDQYAMHAHVKLRVQMSAFFRTRNLTHLSVRARNR